MCDERSRQRGGFTLVELMVVIVIIIILMGLLTPVLINVMARGREGRITSEIATLDGSLKAYKERYGSYPPSDFVSYAGQQTVLLHLAHAFPRCNPQTEILAIPGYVAATSTTTLGSGPNAAQALVFWLSGFSTDPEHPISGHYPLAGVTPNPPLPLTALFPFDPTRVTLNGTAVAIGYGSNSPGSVLQVPIYGPADGLGTPYVYFAAQNYATQQGIPGSQNDYCLPYLLDNGPNTNPANPFVNPSTFQIISAGLDGNFGNAASWNASTNSAKTLGSYPSGQAATYSGFTPTVSAYSQGDLDNLTNFNEGALRDKTAH